MQKTGPTSCSTCFFTDEFPGVTIEDNGRCSVCNSYGEPAGTGERSDAKLSELKDEILRLKGDSKSKYDCIIGCSGGLDSSYVLYVVRKMLGLNPLIVHYDSGFVHELPKRNLREMCERLDVDLIVEQSAKRHDHRYLRAMARALRGSGLFWGVCRFCHYVLSAAVYRHALARDIRVLMSSDNIYEKNLHMDRGYKRQLMKRAVMGGGLLGLPRFAWWFAVASYHLLRLRLEYYVPPVRTLFRTAPAMPPSIGRVNVTKYVPWEIDRMVEELAEVGWRAPEGTKLPMRFDCMIEDGFMNRTYKEVGGLTIHGIICNNMIYEGLRTKDDLEQDVASYAAGVQRNIDETFERLGLRK